jgi:hypothetical protein
VGPGRTIRELKVHVVGVFWSLHVRRLERKSDFLQHSLIQIYLERKEIVIYILVSTDENVLPHCHREKLRRNVHSIGMTTG